MLGPLEDVLADAAERAAEDARRSSTIVHRNALRLLKLVNTLLDFSRIEAGPRPGALSSRPTWRALTARARQRLPLGDRARRARA